MFNMEVYGEMNLYLHKKKEGIGKILEKFAKGETNPREEKLLKSVELLHVKKRNLMMDRFFDRIAAAFSQSNSVWYIRPGYGGVPGSSPGYDYNIVQNTVQGQANIIVGPIPISSQYMGNVPELIGLGSGNTPVDREDRGLYTPFPHTLGVGPFNYRNTYNSKEVGNFATQVNRVIRCGTTWEAAYVPPASIREVGLFNNVWMVALRNWVLGQIIISGAGNINRAWEILNITTWINTAVNRYELWVFQRNDAGAVLSESFTWNEITQTITYNGTRVLPGIPPNVTLISFSPRYDHQSDPGVGSADNFVIPPAHADFSTEVQLMARAVLPSPIAKNANETLTIIWLIYFKRVI